MALWPHLFKEREVTHACDACPNEEAVWCPPFSCYLCVQCLNLRIDDEERREETT